MAVSGFNHVTLAVSNLDRVLDFYARVLGFTPVVCWSTGAYLTAGNLWLALVAGDGPGMRAKNNYSHIAFSCTEGEFDKLVENLQSAGHGAWQENRSEGGSCYFRDPDGHKFEIHRGELASRLADMKREPRAEFEHF